MTPVRTAMFSTAIRTALLAALLAGPAAAQTALSPESQAKEAHIDAVASELSQPAPLPDDVTDRLGRMGETATVEVVPLTRLRQAAPDGGKSLDGEMDRQKDKVEDARLALAANEHLNDAIQARNYNAMDVALLRLDGDQRLTVVVDDRD